MSNWKPGMLPCAPNVICHLKVFIFSAWQWTSLRWKAIRSFKSLSWATAVHEPLQRSYTMLDLTYQTHCEMSQAALWLNIVHEMLKSFEIEGLMWHALVEGNTSGCWDRPRTDVTQMWLQSMQHWFWGRLYCNECLQDWWHAASDSISNLFFDHKAFEFTLSIWAALASSVQTGFQSISQADIHRKQSITPYWMIPEANFSWSLCRTSSFSAAVRQPPSARRRLLASCALGSALLLTTSKKLLVISPSCKTKLNCC